MPALQKQKTVVLRVSPYGKGHTHTRKQSIDLKQTCNVQLLAAVLECDTIFLEFFVHQYCCLAPHGQATQNTQYGGVSALLLTET